MIFAHPHPTEKRFIPIQLNGSELYVPVFPLSEVPNGMCAMYSRLAAEELFGRVFSASHAWDRRYFDKIVSSKVGHSLTPFALTGTLQPGMIVGIFRPGSDFLRIPDACGREVPYTHNSVFLGLNEDGESLLAEKFEDLVYVRTEQEQRAAGLIPTEIFGGVLQ